MVGTACNKGSKPSGPSEVSWPEGVPREIAADLGGGVKLELVLIPAGEFLMGSPDSDKEANSRQKPQHRVRITKPFHLGKYLVTQEQWEAVVDSKPSDFKGPKNPMDTVSWDDCQKFLEELNASPVPERRGMDRVKPLNGVQQH